ncbi:hypothetical protein NPIL_607411 [Nephila pilipes]|uniref:Uncharacterized protein n=1 Tax=Nephila pilipes TaxID=299642 RepID=A0A8X6UDV4_NEPPI|nr:hypothetical protein NPIL_607411 [Nephila pilipes]
MKQLQCSTGSKLDFLPPSPFHSATKKIKRNGIFPEKINCPWICWSESSPVRSHVAESCNCSASGFSCETLTRAKGLGPAREALLWLITGRSFDGGCYLPSALITTGQSCLFLSQEAVFLV